MDKPKGALLQAIQDYANTQGTPIIYAPGSYPYWFSDPNANGVFDEGEAITDNRFTTFDDRLLPAAFNFHSAQDPCSDIHNYQYVIQTLYDSLDDLDDGQQNNSAPGTRPGAAPPAENQPPTADAGADQTDVALGTPVQLNATGSDPEGQPVTFSWELQVPEESTTATLSDPNIANPTFTPDVAGTYTATVTVSDGQATATDTVVIATAGAEPPPNGGPEPPAIVTLPNAFGVITLDHAFHTTFADCLQCHPSDPPGPFAATLDQTSGHAICLDCHAASDAPTACGACHGN